MDESDLDSSSAPNQQSAAYKAHALRHKLTQAEAELAAKKLASDSRRSIASGTPRLFPLPPSELQLDGLSGRASSERFTIQDGVVALHDSASDGDGHRAPSAEQQKRKIDGEGRVDYYAQLEESEDAYKHWKKVVGKLVAYHVLGQSKDDVRWWIRLPSGYTLWKHVDGSASEEANARKDNYLYGSTTHGTGKTPFRSPAEFAPHFMWLMLGRPEAGCKCQYCTHRPQDEVSAELFGYPSKSEVLSVQGGQNVTPTAGQNRSARKGGGKKKTVDQPIVAKDYRQGI